MNNETKVNILIGTPAYGSMVHTDYLNSILEFHKYNIPITVMTIGNESLITRGRNTIISYFFHNKQFTHLLYLDADIYLSAQGFIKLLSRHKDIIGAPVALKGKDQNGNSVYNIGKQLSEPIDDVIEVNKVGNAIMLLSRKAAETICNEAETYKRNPLTRGDKTSSTHFDVFKTGVFFGEYDSEDFYICRQLRELGFKVYVDLSVQNRHNGNYIFT